MENWMSDLPQWICKALVGWAVAKLAESLLSHFRQPRQRRDSEDSSDCEEP